MPADGVRRGQAKDRCQISHVGSRYLIMWTITCGVPGNTSAGCWDREHSRCSIQHTDSRTHGPQWRLHRCAKWLAVAHVYHISNIYFIWWHTYFLHKPCFLVKVDTLFLSQLITCTFMSRRFGNYLPIYAVTPETLECLTSSIFSGYMINSKINFMQRTKRVLKEL